jgi:hypothetical protein
MPTREEIIDALGQLDQIAFEDVINAAFQRRADHTPADLAAPLPAAEPEEFARWFAQRHMSSDPALARVVYLPSGAPRGEIRLLEVNRFQIPHDNDVIEPLDFSPDIDEIPFKVFVADITTDQWERIQRESGTTLPVGWRLDGNRIYSRG